MSTMDSRTRPRRQPNPDVAALRSIRRATRDYLVVLDAALAALTDEAIESKPQLAYLQAALAIAAGRRGTNAGSGFGTPIQIEAMLSRLLGEEETRT
jgi:hypothetical protein